MAKTKPKVMIEAVIAGKTLEVSFNLQDFKERDNKEQKLLRAFVAAIAEMINDISTKE